MAIFNNAQTKTTLRFGLSLLCIGVISCLSVVISASSAQVEKRDAYPIYPNIEVTTNQGNFYMSLDANRAPITTKNFLDYVTEEQYNNTIFHRVISDFVAQGGGYDEKFNELPTRSEIFNESGNGLSNIRGSIAMARHFDPHTATAQFYINLADNEKLDPRPDRWGYTVFGEISGGMHILDELAAQPTGPGGDFEKDVPIEAFIVKSMRIMDADEEIPVEEILPEPIDQDDSVNKESNEEETVSKIIEDKAKALKEKLVKPKDSEE